MTNTNTDILQLAEDIVAIENNKLSAAYSELSNGINQIKELTPKDIHDTIEQKLHQLDNLFEETIKYTRPFVREYVNSHLRRIFAENKESIDAFKLCKRHDITILMGWLPDGNPIFEPYITSKHERFEQVSFKANLRQKPDLCKLIYFMQKHHRFTRK